MSNHNTPTNGFKKGQSGNPAGRKPLVKSFSEIAREMMQSKLIDIEYTYPDAKKGVLVTKKMHIESDKTIHHSLVAALIKEGLGGNIAAINQLIDRTEGAAKQEHEVKGDLNVHLVRTVVTHE